MCFWNKKLAFLFVLHFYLAMKLGILLGSWPFFLSDLLVSVVSITNRIDSGLCVPLESPSTPPPPPISIIHCIFCCRIIFSCLIPLFFFHGSVAIFTCLCSMLVLKTFTDDLIWDSEFPKPHHECNLYILGLKSQELKTGDKTSLCFWKKTHTQREKRPKYPIRKVSSFQKRLSNCY